MRVFFGSLFGFLVYITVFALGPISAVLIYFHGERALIYPVWMALFLALITPFAIIAIRSEIRFARLRLIDLFAANFRLKPYDGDTDLVTFEFVRGKYFGDLPKADADRPIDELPRFPRLLHADWMLLLCALPYIVFAACGVFLLFAAEGIFRDGGQARIWFGPSLLSIGGLPASIIGNQQQATAYFMNVLTIGGLAFAGAYFFTLRLFLRAVVTFDLSPITFLRAFAHMVMAVILAIAIYRVFPSMADLKSAVAPIAEAAKSSSSSNLPKFDPEEGLNSLWIAVAFAFGFIPDSALNYVLQKSGIVFKDRYSNLEEHSKVVPLTLLDGIDHLVAFRLEEANIFDVQNLATYNPIMLHVESPFGFYETVDWVAQAQLCTVCGPERFLALKMLNLRTIFDLKRAVESDNPDLLDAIAELLLQDDKRDADYRTKVNMGRLPALQVALNTPGALSPEARRAALKALVQVMADDLHVLRLEQLWDWIDAELRRKRNSEPPT